MKEQVMDFYNNDSNRPFEISFGQDGKTVGTMIFNGSVMTFEGEADAAAAVFIDMIVKKQSQQWLDAQEKISTSEFAFNEFFQKTNWVQDDKRFDVITPWGKHRADVLKEYIDYMEAKCAALAAEVQAAEKRIAELTGKPASEYADDADLLLEIDFCDDLSTSIQVSQWLKELRIRRAAGIINKVGE